MKEVYVVENDYVGKRLDVYLSDVNKDFTRSQIKKSIEEGLTTVNGQVVKSGKTLKLNDEVVFESLEYETDIEPENIPLDIIYEDEDLAVINKPQGMTVHPAPGNYSGTLVNALLYHFKNIINDIDIYYCNYLLQ